MIRDPSDGSVRAPQKPAPDFGAPQNIARLEKSREWLKSYFHRKTEGT